VSEPIRINVDPTNPGQFFACCGLLELADRLWPEAQGWFEDDNSRFCLSSPADSPGLQQLIEKLPQAGLRGELSVELAKERNQLEEKKRRLKKDNKTLSKGEEKRRKELGILLREGVIVIDDPFRLHLDWWQDDSESNPKTWAGSQQVLRIAQAALMDTVRAFNGDRPFDFACVMRPLAAEGQDTEPRPSKGRPNKNVKDKIEPFYFDSRHGANALPLDIGFSPNELGMESNAFPAVELLCLIGLQRCRPNPTNTPLVFEYFPWQTPLPVLVAPAAVSGFLGQSMGYRFENAYRTDQRKHKGYLNATVFRR
jgi:hypothetical protein